MDGLLVRARSLWEGLAAVPVSFSTDVPVVVSPAARICPPGWAGVIVLDGQAIVTAPDSAVAARIGTVAGGLPIADLTDPDVLTTVLPVAEVLGPATLAYVDADSFRPVSHPASDVERVRVGHPDLRRLAARVGESDTDESGLEEITSPVFAVRDESGVIAAAGYRSWPDRVAHLGVLTATDRRGLGLARVTGSAAVSHALAEGLLPQWRARSLESRKVATALGFRELGAQLSFRVV